MNTHFSSWEQPKGAKCIKISLWGGWSTVEIPGPTPASIHQRGSRSTYFECVPSNSGLEQGWGWHRPHFGKHMVCDGQTEIITERQGSWEPEKTGDLFEITWETHSMACLSGRGGGKAGVTVIHPGPWWGVQGQPPATEPPGRQPDSQDGCLGSKRKRGRESPCPPGAGPRRWETHRPRTHWGGWSHPHPHLSSELMAILPSERPLRGVGSAVGGMWWWWFSGPQLRPVMPKRLTVRGWRRWGFLMPVGVLLHQDPVQATSSSELLFPYL